MLYLNIHFCGRWRLIYFMLLHHIAIGNLFSIMSANDAYSKMFTVELIIGTYLLKENS